MLGCLINVHSIIITQVYFSDPDLHKFQHIDQLYIIMVTGINAQILEMKREAPSSKTYVTTFSHRAKSRDSNDAVHRLLLAVIGGDREMRENRVGETTGPLESAEATLRFDWI